MSCAAGLAAQMVVEEERLMEHALQMEKRYRTGLKHPFIHGIAGRGLFLAVELEKGWMSVSSLPGRLRTDW